MVDCCKHSKSDKKCIRKSDKKSFNLPRRFSKKKCKKPKGFTMRSSCAPYKDCFSNKKRTNKRKKKRTNTRYKKKSGGSKLIKVYFAGGCFWGIEEKFSKLNGVVNTQVGYMGGKIKNPDYKSVSTGKTGYSETVMVEYDPKIISYLELLRFFFDSHDPFSLDKQDADIGPQYRAIVFYESSKQKKIYEKFLKEFSKSNDKSDTIKTKLLKKKKFYIAEDYHQKYNFQKECSSLNTENETVFKKICKNNTKLAEKPGSGKYNSIDYLSGEIKGIYRCSCCNSELYSSKHIYDSGTGWPAFSQTIKKDSILFNESTSELRCRNCGLHLGHRTFDGPTKTKIHDCINSACLHFVENNNKRSNKRSKKRSKKRTEKRSKKYKKLTKLGKEWVKLASEDMKKRELEFSKNNKNKKKKKNTKKGGKRSKRSVVLPKLRPISYKNKKHRYHIKDPKKKRILAIEEGIRSESKKGKSKRDAAISKKARFNVLRIYRKNNNYQECKRLTDDMKYISKKYKLGKTKNICLK